MSTTPPARTDRELDVVLVGASGFVGQLTAAHLAAEAGSARIALAGRSTARLTAVRDELGAAAADWPIIEVDAHDSDGLRALAARTRVVATTVGPYHKLGMPLAAACALRGTHYADLTGEVLFVRRCADMLHEEARRSGARIVNSCGFDSVPSDLAVLLTATAALEAHDGGLTDATLYVRKLRAGFSGGTVDSARQQAIAMAEDPWAKKVLTDPYALSADRDREPRRRTRSGSGSGSGAASGSSVGAVLGALTRSAKVARSMVPVSRDASDGHWYGPFVMAPFNTRLVRRSNSLTGWSYGRDLSYREVLDLGSSPTAPLIGTGMAAAMGGVFTAMGSDLLRPVVDRWLPAPGEGPSEQTRRSGRFLVELLASTVTGARYRTVVGAHLDPGYDGTAVMFGQSALALAGDPSLLPDRAGVLTPATGIGAVLAERLRGQGFTVTTERIG